MPRASSSAPCFSAAAAAGVSLGEAPPGATSKNEPPPALVHNPDQSGSRSKRGDCCPPPAACFIAEYRSQAVRCWSPSADMRCHSACDCDACCATVIGEAVAMNARTAHRLIGVIAGCYSTSSFRCTEGEAVRIGQKASPNERAYAGAAQPDEEGHSIYRSSPRVSTGFRVLPVRAASRSSARAALRMLPSP